MLHKVVFTLQCVVEVLKCSHSNESYCALLSNGVVYFSLVWRLKFLA